MRNSFIWAIAVLSWFIGSSSYGYDTEGALPEALTINEDGAKRSPEIHWPKGYRPEQADLFAHNEISIDASCSKVWKNLIQAERWPSWYSNAQDVKVLGSETGTLEAKSKFSWMTFGLHISSRVNEFVPKSRLGWFGDGKGTSAYHTFLLVPVEQGCHILTEEVVKGPDAVEFREKDPNEMHKAHDLWLKSLKTMSEK